MARTWQPRTCRECGCSIKRQGEARMDVREYCEHCRKQTAFRRADLEKEDEPEVRDWAKRRDAGFE